MEIANISIAALALVVAIIAIIISICQANKSDKISLMGLRIDFYNRLSYIALKYIPLTKLKVALNAKNANVVFREITGNRTMNLVFSTLSHGQNQIDVSIIFKQILDDMNYLDINKYLFEDEETVSEIDEIIDKLNQFRLTLSANFRGESKEAELQDALEALGNTFESNIDKLSSQIKDVIKLQQ